MVTSLPDPKWRSSKSLVATKLIGCEKELFTGKTKEDIAEAIDEPAAYDSPVIQLSSAVFVHVVARRIFHPPRLGEGNSRLDQNWLLLLESCGALHQHLLCKRPSRQRGFLRRQWCRCLWSQPQTPSVIDDAFEFGSLRQLLIEISMLE